MATVNPIFFVIRISKAEQKKKRSKLTTSTVGFLGLKYSEQESNNGFIVYDTEKDSPADLSGLRRGDKIKAINGEPVNNYNEMISVVMKYPPGIEISIDYISSFSVDDTTVSNKKVILAERPLVLDIPEGTEDMRFNLQFGEIVSIGTKAAKEFPEALIGDMLLVHHSVEYKQRAQGDKNWNDWHLLETDNDFEYRIAHCTKEVLGVWKRELAGSANAIIPYRDFIFCHSNIKKSSFLIKDGIYQHDSWEASMEDMTEKLEILKNQIEELNTSTVMHQRDNDHNYKQREEIRSAIDKIQEERRSLTKKMHQKKLVECTVIFIHPLTNIEYLTDIQPGDIIGVDLGMIYPLDIFGAYFALLRPGHCEYLIKP